MKTADKFTCVRLLFAPLFFLIYIIPVWTGKFNFTSACIMLPLLGFAEFTDFLDGFFARKQNSVSDFGKLFDPFADVVLHLTAFVCYVASGYMPLIILVLIFYREFGMMFLRMMAAKQNVAIAARKGGKLKTVLYVSSSIVCLFLESVNRLGLNLGSAQSIIKIILYCLFIACVIASYVSFFDYIINFKKIIEQNKNNK